MLAESSQSSMDAYPAGSRAEILLVCMFVHLHSSKEYFPETTWLLNQHCSGLTRRFLRVRSPRLIASARSHLFKVFRFRYLAAQQGFLGRINARRCHSATSGCREMQRMPTASQGFVGSRHRPPQLPRPCTRVLKGASSSIGM